MHQSAIELGKGESEIKQNCEQLSQSFSRMQPQINSKVGIKTSDQLQTSLIQMKDHQQSSKEELKKFLIDVEFFKGYALAAKEAILRRNALIQHKYFLIKENEAAKNELDLTKKDHKLE